MPWAGDAAPKRAVGADVADVTGVGVAAEHEALLHIVDLIFV
jgi:hypothetical protein